MPLLNQTENQQLGGNTPQGVPHFQDLAHWFLFRDFLVQKSRKRNPSHFDESLAAYTPGETLELLKSKPVQSWFRSLETWSPPDDAQSIILVPCAASKPWRHSPQIAKSLLYKGYNTLIDQIESGSLQKSWFVTVSEPLGLVPQEFWAGDFPKYDNPGLFRDDFLRTGLLKSDWIKQYGHKIALPFDLDAYQQCIAQLGNQIGRVLSRSTLPIFSFVDSTEKTTHSSMLDAALLSQPQLKIHRFLKKEKSRTSPDLWITQCLQKEGILLPNTTLPPPNPRRQRNRK